MKAARTHSIEIKKRFIKAVEQVAQKHYPSKSQSDIVISLGLTTANYYRMRSRTEGNYPTLDQCVLLCKQYKISGEWLLTGEGEMKKINGKKITAADLLRQALIIIENKARNKN